MFMPINPLAVLVVDDELPLREELRLFPWSACNAELAGEAENGEEALELCRKLSPDVVITDITMPVMDGMELFRNIKREFPLTQVILLTCHSDFDYARDAVKLGALEYLVKISLLDSELEQALDRARQAIDRDRNYRRSETDKQRWKLSGLLRQLADSKGAGPRATGEATAVSALKEAALPIVAAWKLPPPFRVARVHVNAGAENEIYVHHELQVIFSEWEQAAQLILRWIPLGNTDYLLLFRSASDESDLVRQMGSTLEELQAELDRRLSYVSEAVRLFAAVSSPLEDGGALLDVIGVIRVPQSADFYDSSGAVYRSGVPETTDAPVISVQEKDKMLARLRKAAVSGRDGLSSFVRSELTDWAAIARPEPDELKRWLLQAAKELNDGAKDDDLDKRRSKLLLSRTMAELTSAFVRELEAADGVKSKCRKEVAVAKLLIAERLAEPLTLTLISDEVGLSSFYLSRLFREEVGESFNEYVTRLRIDKAIHLLQTTHLKVYEVAEQVGIPSYRYFSVLFRNRTGVAPTDFKKG
ncbi:response regulator transcription factor [Paenibacillus piri]|nr:response regulator [Paenibacillus piri]